MSVLLSSDRRGRVAVVRRPDGLFCLYEHWYWSVEVQKRWGLEPAEDRTWSARYDSSLYDNKEPLQGLYGTLADAEKEARSRLALTDDGPHVPDL